MHTLGIIKRKMLVRTCSVCGVEIDKTTAYTVSGEQKAQGRRCINCVEGAESEAKSAPVTEKASVSQPQKTQPTVSTAANSDDAESSTVKYAVIAVVVAVIIWLVLG